MKNLLIICIFSPCLLEAEAYSGWHMEVQIEMTNGEQWKGIFINQHYILTGILQSKAHKAKAGKSAQSWKRK